MLVLVSGAVVVVFFRSHQARYALMVVRPQPVLLVEACACLAEWAAVPWP